MCGIAGQVRSDGSPRREVLEAMCGAQRHRGPDSRGIYLEGGAGLGVQRLRVIDLETGDQPIYNEDRSVAVVLNGEIYNYRELREELLARGHSFSTSGDTEPIVHLYEELGDECVHRLAGMFAFALWDARHERLLVARDRVGKKPLHYHHAADGTLSFASEIGSLVAAEEVPRRVDPTSLDTYLAYGYVRAPHSIWADVRKLPPGHLMSWRAGRLQVDCWWRLDFGEPLERPLPELESELRERIGAAVERRMIADVPLGAFLSGGVDSAIVVAEMARRSREPVRTFSIGFRHEAYNELPLARLLSERYGTEHTEFVVEPHTVELLPDLVHHYGEPFADSSALPSYQLAELTRAHVTVALNGDGGDESFAGYLRHVVDSRTAFIDSIPMPLRRLGARTGERMRAPEHHSRRAYAKRLLETLTADGAGRYARRLSIFSEAERRALLVPELAAQVDEARTAAAMREPWQTASTDDPVNRLLQVEVDTYLPGDLLVKMDIASMAHSLEARSPLLDHEVMEFAARLPGRLKIRGRQRKWLLRRAYRDELPQQILSAPKRGFSVPLGEWLRGPLRGMLTERLVEDGTLDGWVRRDAVTALLDAHMRGRSDFSARLWSLLFLAEWRRQFA